METNDKTLPITPEKDRNSVSLDLMHRMRLHGMAAAFAESLQATFAETMTPDSFLNWLLSREWDFRAARNIERLVKTANFRYDASVAQIDYTLPRGLDRNQMERLASLDFVRKQGGQPVHHRLFRNREKLSGNSTGIRGLQGRYARPLRKRFQTYGHPENRKKQGNDRD